MTVTITPEMLKRATEGVLRVHEEEVRAFLAGEIEAATWRPERYAEGAVRAALEQWEPRPDRRESLA